MSFSKQRAVRKDRNAMSTSDAHKSAHLQEAPIETITAAAVKVGDLILSIPQPGRHHTVLHEMDRLGIDAIEHGWDQGFITSAGRFVDRIEGCWIATAAGQIKHKTGPSNILFSECMW